MNEGAPARRTLAWLPAALIIFAVLAHGLSLHGFRGDIGWDLSNGLWILAHHRIPLHNHLTQAMAGAPWWDSEWLWAIATAGGWQLGGRIGVYLVALVPLALLAGLLGVLLRRAQPYWDLMLAIVVAFAMLPAMSPRPQLASYALFALLLAALCGARRDERAWPLWLAAALTLPWTNVHGSAVLAPGLFAVFWLFGTPTLRRRLSGPLLLSALLFGVHPGGFAVSQSLLAHIASPANLNVIQEWGSPDFHDPALWAGGVLLVVGLVPLTPWLMARRRHAEVTLIVGSVVATLLAVRFLPYMVIAVVPLVGEMLPASVRLAPSRAAGQRAAAIGLVAALGIGLLAMRGKIFPNRYPAQATAWLAAHHAQNVFAWYSAGGMLEPFSVRPYLDGRNDLWLSQPLWPQYLAVYRGGESVLAFLRRFDPTARYVLWYSRSPVALVLDRSPAWRRVFVDPDPGNPQRGAQGVFVIWKRLAAHG